MQVLCKDREMFLLWTEDCFLAILLSCLKSVSSLACRRAFASRHRRNQRQPTMHYIQPEFVHLAEFCTKSDMIEIIIAWRTVQDKGDRAGGDDAEKSTQLFEECFDPSCTTHGNTASPEITNKQLFIFPHKPFVCSSVPGCCPESPAPVTSTALVRRPSGHVTRSISHWATWCYLIHTKPQTASYRSHIVSHDWWSGGGGAWLRSEVTLPWQNHLLQHLSTK